MSGNHFRVVYDGPAVVDGEMDVAQLASSLLALGKLIEAADTIYSGEAGRIRVKVQADVQRGSFDVGIALSFFEAAYDWVKSPDGQAAGTILSLLGFSVPAGAVGLIQAVRWLRGRRIDRRVTLKDGRTTLELETGEALTVPLDVARMIEEPAVRQHLEKFTEPLRDDGVEQIRFEQVRGVVAERIIESEAASFEAQAGAAPTSVSRFEATYQIKRLYFERGKKWRLSNGSQTIMAPVEDEAFWRNIENSQTAFSAADYLVCLVRMDQWLGANGLKTEFSIERVEKHIPAPKQPRLALDV